MENAPKSGRPVSASCNEIVSKLTKLLRDARYTVRDIARTIGISLSRVDYEGPAKRFVTGFGLLQCYVLSNIFLLQTFKLFPFY